MALRRAAVKLRIPESLSYVLSITIPTCIHRGNPLRFVWVFIPLSNSDSEIDPFFDTSDFEDDRAGRRKDRSDRSLYDLTRNIIFIVPRTSKYKIHHS